MIDHIWTLVCSRAVIDNRTKNVSAQNILEQLKIQDIPKPDGMLNIPFDVVTLWGRSDVDSPLEGVSRLSFVFPSGEIAGIHEYEINLLDTQNYRYIAHFEQIPVREPGRHYFRVALKLEDEGEWLEVNKIPIMIIFEPPEDEEEEITPKENMKPLESEK
jgi:hypothetical protein